MKGGNRTIPAESWATSQPQGAGLRARPAWTRALPGPSDVHTFSCHHTQQPGRVPLWHHHSGGQLFDGQLP